ncbi:MAG: LamG domain-containing protein [Candidatus Aenigmarchaeota archaeon]|nr:LamG domain-containing protein [Candidatus Aenigmarchaeota archaeon]
MAGDRFLYRKNILLLTTLVAFALSFAFMAQAFDLEGAYFITAEQPKNSDGLGFFRIGTPLDADVNISFSYPIPLSPGEADLTAVVYKPTNIFTNMELPCSLNSQTGYYPVNVQHRYYVPQDVWYQYYRAGGRFNYQSSACINGLVHVFTEPFEMNTISLGDIIKAGDINGNQIVSGNPPTYDFKEYFFDFTLNLTYDNVSEEGIDFKYNYTRDIEKTEMSNTDDLEVALPTGDNKYHFEDYDNYVEYRNLLAPPKIVYHDTDDGDSNEVFDSEIYVYSETVKAVTFYVRGYNDDSTIDDKAAINIYQAGNPTALSSSGWKEHSPFYHSFTFLPGIEYRVQFRLKNRADHDNEHAHFEVQISSPSITNHNQIWSVINSGIFNVDINQEFWKITQRQGIFDANNNQRLDNYCSGPQDFYVKAATGIKSESCDGTDVVITATNQAGDSDDKVAHIANGGFLFFKQDDMNDTSYHFETVVRTGKALEIEFAVMVNYGVSVYVDGDLSKGFRIGCPSAEDCANQNYYTPSEKLNIPAGYHKIDIYLFCKDGQKCFLEMKAIEKNGNAPEIFFKDNFDEIGKPVDSNLEKNPIEANSGQAVTFSTEDGLVDVERKEPVYFESGLYKDLEPVKADNVDEADDRIQLSMRLACGEQIYQPCRDFGKWGACTTDNNGWIRNRILHENYADYELVEDDNGDYTIAKFTIEPFDHHSLDYTNNANAPNQPGQHNRTAYGGEYIGGIYECKMNWPNYETECPDPTYQYSFSGFECCYQKYTEADNKPTGPVWWSGISKDPDTGEQVGTIHIRDFKESTQTSGEAVIYIVNYLPYGGYTSKLDAEYMNFSMFDERPKLCAYVTKKVSLPHEYLITFNNTHTCNKVSATGDCCYCDPNSVCTLNCKNREDITDMYYATSLITANSLRASSFNLPFTTMGSGWYLENINVSVIVDSDTGSNVSVSVENTSATRWKTTAEMKEGSQRLLQEGNYTVSVNLHHDFGFNVSDDNPGTYYVNFTLDYINFSKRTYSDAEFDFGSNEMGNSSWEIYLNQYNQDDYPSSVRDQYVSYSPLKPQEIDVKKISFSGESGSIVDYGKRISFRAPPKNQYECETAAEFAAYCTTCSGTSTRGHWDGTKCVCSYPSESEKGICFEVDVQAGCNSNCCVCPESFNNPVIYWNRNVCQCTESRADNKPPTITILNESGSTINDNTATIKGTAYDLGGLADIRISIESTEQRQIATLNDLEEGEYEWEAELSFSYPATYTVSATATDLGRNTNSVSITITVSDTAFPPTITINAPEEGHEFFTTTTKVNLEISTNRDALCRYSTSDLGYDEMEPTQNFTEENPTTNFKAEVPVYSNQRYTYYFACTDGTKSHTSADNSQVSFDVLGVGGREPIDLECSEEIVDESTCTVDKCNCGPDGGIPIWNAHRGCICTKWDNVCRDVTDCKEDRNGGPNQYRYCDTEYNMCYDNEYTSSNLKLAGGTEPRNNINFTASECTVIGSETRFIYDWKSHPGTYDDFGACASDGTCPDGGICAFVNEIESRCILPRGGCSLGLQVCGPGYRWLYAESEEEPVYNKPETCNRIDDDCNGWIDDTVNFTTMFKISLELAGSGIGRSPQEITQCQCFNGLPPEEEVCDSIDNDCDGIIDNDVKYVLRNNCTEEVLTIIDIGNPPTGYSLYDFAYNKYYSDECTITNETIRETQNLTVNPCTDEVYECMQLGKYHTEIIYNNDTDEYEFPYRFEDCTTQLCLDGCIEHGYSSVPNDTAQLECETYFGSASECCYKMGYNTNPPIPDNALQNTYEYCAEKYYNPYTCIPLEEEMYYVPGELCNCEFTGTMYDSGGITQEYLDFIKKVDSNNESYCSSYTPFSTECCNGIDDNCDALLDNTEYPELCACYGIDNTTIRDETWTINDMNCTGRDENCDGTINENALFCNCTQTLNLPNATTIKEALISDESCNGIDDNCNNEYDEDFPVNTSCGGTNVSRCYGGVYVCNATGYNAVCNTTADISEINTDEGFFGTATGADLRIPEVCSGEDSDCNGTVDDTAHPELCNCYNYENLWEIQDIWENNTDDNCNGIDDNCNMRIDDESFSCACTNKTESEVVQIKTVNETCDGIDNNCNGFADETYSDIGKMCGFGACANGVMVCDVYGMRTVCNTTVDAADTYSGIAQSFISDEVCDLVGDEDCDGSIDEGCACTPQGIKKICGYASELVYNNRQHIDSICNEIRSQLRNMVSKSSSPGDMKYRRTIKIKNSNSYVVKDYPVRVDLSVIGSTKIRSDFGDVRVQDASGNELPWRRDGGSIVFKSSLLSAGNNKYTLYYGSPVRTYSEKSMTEIYGLERYQETFLMCDFNYNTQCNKGNMVPRASDVSVFSIGRYEAAMLFNSTNHTLRYASSANINLNRGTVEMWIKTSSSSGTLFHLPAAAGSIKLEINAGAASLARDSSVIASGGSVSDDQWHHIVVGWDNLIGMSLYVDGNKVGGSVVAWTPNNMGTDIFIGSEQGAANYYAGLIDELRISKTKLSDGEVKADARLLGGSISPSLANEEDMGSVGGGSGQLTDSELYYECLERLENAAGAPENSDNENSILSLCSSMITCNSDFSIDSASVCRVGVQSCSSSGWSDCSGNVVPQTEVCNRRDDDCNGLTDDFLYAQDTCACYNGNPPNGPEECNGVDDDCNAQVDDGFGGRCACSSGQRAQGDEPRICNGIDDNCNGIIDENVSNCACADATFAEINQRVGTERCNGIDDDCDGEIDEDFANVGNTCGGDQNSACYGGYYICKADGTGTVCSTTTDGVQLLGNLTSIDLRTDETCNGIDDDCDGERDENIPRCACADGAQNTGGYEPQVCNGIDDNCNGLIDEGVLKCPCADKTLEDVESFITPDLTCDDIDNDCNGIVDDQYPQLGEVCGGNPRSACYGGKYVCSIDEVSVVCNTMTPPENSFTGKTIDRRSEESCNGIDDDCNDVIDDLAGSNSNRYCACYNGMRLPGELVERCNGIDEDCDGVIDNNVPMCGCSGVSTMISNSKLVQTIDGKRASSEICNNIDDNCDGGIDDGLGKSCYCTGGYNGTALGRPEFCNAVDDNCNGVIDDIPKPYACACYNGAHGAGELTEICNGIDDDCNGIVDEEYPEKGAFCGVGICTGGMYECSQDNLTTTCSGNRRAISAALEHPSYCNTYDDNCNIAVDEGCGTNASVTNRSCGSDIGECSSGLQLLVGGKWGPCMTIGQNRLKGPEIEVCDSLDNDCDGIIDNIGGKTSTETTRCGCYGGAQPSTEECNGIDDDCDGTIDNIGGKTSVESTKCGCYDDEYGRGASIERCNGIDDDCDGIVDNVKEEESVEATKCGCYGGLVPTAERCNGIDDNCDERIDEDFVELGKECGIGYCSGVYICSQDGLQSVCNGNTPTTEICDSIDNDCDGKIDEGCYGSELTSCENGIRDGREEGIDCGGPCPDECMGTHGPSVDDLNTKKENIKSTWFTIFLVMVVLIIGIGIVLQFGLKTK